MIEQKPRDAVFLSAKAPALRTDATPLRASVIALATCPPHIMTNMDSPSLLMSDVKTRARRKQ